jgi:hypothetical protein
MSLMARTQPTLQMRSTNLHGASTDSEFIGDRLAQMACHDAFKTPRRGVRAAIRDAASSDAGSI